MNTNARAIHGIQIAVLPDCHYLFTLAKPGQGVMNNGICYVRESDWPAVSAYLQTLVCIDKARASASGGCQQ